MLSYTNINKENAKNLSLAAAECWNALLKKDISNLGKAIRKSFEAQIAMYPHMVNKEIFEVLNKYKDKALGWKLSGAGGGGGYLTFISETPLENAIQIRIRRSDI